MCSENWLEHVLFLDLKNILFLHGKQIELYGGAKGLRSESMLLSAIAQPPAKFGGNYLHTTLFEMSAAYLYHIVLNHPFVDGNKRTGLVSALTFLDINEVEIDASPTHLEELTLAVAQHQLTKAEIALQLQHEMIML